MEKYKYPEQADMKKVYYGVRKDAEISGHKSLYDLFEVERK